MELIKYVTTVLISDPPRRYHSLILNRSKFKSTVQKCCMLHSGTLKSQIFTFLLPDTQRNITQCRVSTLTVPCPHPTLSNTQKSYEPPNEWSLHKRSCSRCNPAWHFINKTYREDLILRFIDSWRFKITMLCQNVKNQILSDTASHPRRMCTSFTPMQITTKMFQHNHIKSMAWYKRFMTQTQSN